jgi:small-conductance mechanosensitive channel/CRP-like cAMP-binding protein
VIQLIDNLTGNYWHLLLTLLASVLLWHIGTRVVGEHPLAQQLPRVTAALDVLMLPIWVSLGGSLLRVGNKAFGVDELDGPLRWTTLLLAYLSLGWAIARFIEVQLAHRAEQGAHEQVPKLIIGLIYTALLLCAVAVFAWQQGYSFAGFWVSTGVAAAVLGLALQRTLGDLFSGITLGLERPFRIGDWLELADGTLGQVVDMNWRATRLRAWDNATHIIPNGRLAGESIRNLHGDGHVYAPWYFVKIPAEVEPRFATALLLEAALRCESVLKFPSPVVRLADATTVPYSYMVWISLKNYPAMFRAREELFREIHRGLHQAGIEVAPEVHELRTRRAHVTKAEPPTIALALKALDFAALLTDAELADLAERASYQYHDTGKVLVAEGGASDAFYVVAGGLVESAIRLGDGSRKVVGTLIPGEHFGIAAMLTPEASFLELRAKSDVALIRIDLDALRPLVAARPELAEHFAAIVKERLDAAEAARAQSRRRVRSLSLRDIQAGIERRLRGRR